MSRLFINMTRRFAYPFLPAIAHNLDTSLTSVQNVIATQSGIGLTSPLFAPLSEYFGRKRVMLVGMMGMVLACIPAIAFPTYGVFFAVMVAFGFVKITFDPTMQAYIGDRVPYEQRAFAIGITELAWAGALIIAAPLTGFLLDQYQLQSVFMVLLGLAIIGTVSIWYFIPSDMPQSRHHINVIHPLEAAKTIARSPAAVAAVAFSFLWVIANENMFIVYGAWMKETFHLKLTTLGIVTIVIAAAEVSGEFLVIGIADRVGVRRLTLIGTSLGSLMYAILPTLSGSLAATLVGLFVLFLGVEIAIVASIALFTEVLPKTRAIMMSGNVAAHSLGRFGGAALGGFIYQGASFEVNGLFSAILGLSAALIFYGWVFVGEARP